jgi:hypothetical protein
LDRRGTSHSHAPSAHSLATSFPSAREAPPPNASTHGGSTFEELGSEYPGLHVPNQGPIVPETQAMGPPDVMQQPTKVADTVYSKAEGMDFWNTKVLPQVYIYSSWFKGLYGTTL